MSQVVFDASMTRTIQERSCDLCYIRKIKCSRDLPCKACTGTASSCTYQRRLGYRPRDKQKTRRQQTGRASSTSRGNTQTPPTGPAGSTPSPPPFASTATSIALPSHSHRGQEPRSVNVVTALSVQTTSQQQQQQQHHGSTPVTTSEAQRLSQSQHDQFQQHQQPYDAFPGLDNDLASWSFPAVASTGTPDAIASTISLCPDPATTAASLISHQLQQQHRQWQPSAPVEVSLPFLDPTFAPVTSQLPVVDDNVLFNAATAALHPQYQIYTHQHRTHVPLIPSPSPFTNSPLSFSSLSPSFPNLQTLLQIFLTRLHPSMPFFPASHLIRSVTTNRQRHDKHFAALLYAICALTLLQPLGEDEAPGMPGRVRDAERMMGRSVRLHGGFGGGFLGDRKDSHDEDVEDVAEVEADVLDFGERPTLDMVMTSIFLFGCQFSRGKHGAARVRLREAISMAEVMRLEVDGGQSLAISSHPHSMSSSYYDAPPSVMAGFLPQSLVSSDSGVAGGESQRAMTIAPEERDMRLRTMISLSIIERIYAIQRDYPLNHQQQQPQQDDTRDHDLNVSGSQSQRHNDDSYPSPRHYGPPPLSAQTMSMAGEVNPTSRRLYEMVTQTSSHGDMAERKAIEGLRKQLEQVDFVDDTFVRCMKDRCWGVSSGRHLHDAGNGWKGQRRVAKGEEGRHLPKVKVVALLKRYACDSVISMSNNNSTSSGGSVKGRGRRRSAAAAVDENDTQMADILVNRYWIRNVVWKLGYRHGFVRDESEVDHDDLRGVGDGTAWGVPRGRKVEEEMAPSYAMVIAWGVVETCEGFRLGCLEAHGVSLVEKLYDIATTTIEIARTHFLPGLTSSSTGISSFGEVGAMSDQPSARPTQLYPGQQHDHQIGPATPVSVTGPTPFAIQADPAKRIHELLNRFLSLFTLLRGGKHPFLKPYTELLMGLGVPLKASWVGIGPSGRMMSPASGYMEGARGSYVIM